MNNNGKTTTNGKRPGGCTGKGFMPGKSGNPAGRPRGSGLTDRLRAVLDADDGAAADRIVAAVVKAAEQGDVAFVRLIWDRIDGPVRQRHQIEAQLPEQAVSDEDVLRLANGMAAQIQRREDESRDIRDAV